MAYDPNVASSIGITTQAAASTAAAKKSGSLGQTDFLKMLVAEMKFQNPMQPQDPSKFMEQISQMSMIQGMQDMQATFKNMADAMSVGQIMQASSLIGRSVMVSGNSGNFLPGSPLRGQVDLPQSTADLRVKIVDASGQVVRVMDMGSRAQGAVDFTWNGAQDDGTQAPAGSYGIVAETTDDGKSVAQETKIAALVRSVDVGASGGVALNLLDGRQFDLKDVSEIF